jgi:amino acid permease
MYFAGVIAIIVPKLDLLTSLVGAVTISILTTLIPASIYLLVDYRKYRKWRLILLIIILFIAFIVIIVTLITNLVLVVGFLIRRYIIIV